jgi:hypothetical protein
MDLKWNWRSPELEKIYTPVPTNLIPIPFLRLGFNKTTEQKELRYVQVSSHPPSGLHVFLSSGSGRITRGTNTTEFAIISVQLHSANAPTFRQLLASPLFIGTPHLCSSELPGDKWIYDHALK